jgi:hypothetical protein
MADSPYDPQPEYPNRWVKYENNAYPRYDAGVYRPAWDFAPMDTPSHPSNALTQQQKLDLIYDTPFDPQANQQGNYPKYDPGPFSTRQLPQPGEPQKLYDPGYPGQETLGRAYENLTSRPTYPSGAPPAPGAPPAQGGAAQQFMGVKPEQGRMPGMEPSMPAGVKGNPWGDPYGRPENLPQGAGQRFMGVQGAPPQGAPQGGGQPSGGGGPSGPLTLNSVMQSLTQANPEMMKTKEGRITLAMAAFKFAPLLIKEDQMEMQRMKMEMNNQLQMLKMQQGEAKLGMQEARLEAYENRINAKGGTKEDKIQKEYDAVSKQADILANHLAVNSNSKELRMRYDATMKRLQTFEDQINPPEQSKVYSDWIKANPSRIEESIPDDVKRILSPEEFKQILERQRTDPENAYARVKWLQQKVGSRESTMEKSYGNY